jgi:cytochrome c
MKSRLVLTAPAALAFAVLLTAEAPAASAGPDGAALFRQRCQSCHSVTASPSTPLAPNLAGVVGRKAASTGFNYSPALKASKLTWTRANLDRFLSGPMRMVPGTRMVISVTDAQQRAAVVDYLAHTGH